MKTFKVGDTVYDSVNFPGEEGYVSNISKDKDFPVEVQFAEDNVDYSKHGRQYYNSLPTLSKKPYEVRFITQ